MAKCKKCLIRVNKWEEIKDWIYTFCSKSCRLEFQREKVRKQNDKIKVRKVKVKEKKHNSVSFLTKKADNLWSELVKMNYNYECQYCGKTENLNSHHLFTRSRRATRWDLDNWICLCSWCHTLSSNFSAHQTSLEFFLWLESIKWRDWIEELNNKSNQVYQVTSEWLKEIINELSLIKNKY